jgi:single-strand DNA-binding protein
MLNKCMIIGNLGADPEMRYTANGSAVTTFRVATSRNYTNSAGERIEETEWFRVVTWARLAETCAQYLQKGRQVYVEGRMQTRSWEQDGQTRYMTELIAQDVRFLGGRQEGGGSGSFAPGLPVGADAEGDIDPDDLPF